MSVFITVSARTLDEMLWRKQQMEVIVKVCSALQVDIGDIMEIVPAQA